MATNGPLFLKRTRSEFLEDLKDSFGDKSDGFTDELRVLLFEMWIRARSRPPFPVHRPEPTDEMKQAELMELLTPLLKNLSSRPGTGDFRRALVQVVQQSITVGQGITRFDNSEGVELKLDLIAQELQKTLDQAQFAEQLDKVLRLEPGLAKYHDPIAGQVELELQPNSSPNAAGLSELLPGVDSDEDQVRLKTRLEKLGVLAPSNWLPVFQHTDTGARAGVDVPALERQVPRELETWLVYDGSHWLFPHPKPIYTYDECTHVRLLVDGVDQLNSSCMWQYVYDSDRYNDLIQCVMIPGSSGSSQVKAVYTTILKEYGL